MREKNLVNNRNGDQSSVKIKEFDRFMDFRRLFLFIFISSLLINFSNANEIRKKRDNCECMKQLSDPLRCRCHSGNDAYDQICRCARSFFPPCGCQFNQQPQYVYQQPAVTSCKPTCERSCTQSCTAHLQPAPQCASTCQFTCQKTCAEFQISFNQIQATSKNQDVPHVLIVGGTTASPSCQCLKKEQNCPCNCMPKCQQNCQQNCQANGQSTNQCSSTCSRTCESTCLANSVVQEPAVTVPSPASQACTQQCPGSCQKVCVKLVMAMPFCQQQCVQTCNSNCLSMSTTEGPTPEPYSIPSTTMVESTQPSRDCAPVCQPACLKSCTSVYQNQGSQPQTQIQSQTPGQVPNYGTATMPNFGYLYANSIGQGTQPVQQQSSCIQPCMPLCAPSCVAEQQQQAPVQQQPQIQQPVQQPVQQQPKMVTVTICIPQCMPECKSECIQNVASALAQQIHQNPQQPSAATCPSQCQPACRPSCVRSVIQQQAEQTVPLPTEGISCPSQCMPQCQPSCLLQQTPNFAQPAASPSLISSSAVQSSMPFAYSMPIQTGHLQPKSTLQNKSKFTTLTNQQNNDKPKTCIASCMPLCLDECVNAGVDKHEERNLDKQLLANKVNNFGDSTTTTTAMPQSFSFNIVDGQGAGQVKDNGKPMRVMIHYTAQNTPSTTPVPLTTQPMIQTTPPQFVSKLMPASMATNLQRNDVYDNSNLVKQTSNPRFHIGTSTHSPNFGPTTTTTQPQPSIIHPTSNAGRSSKADIPIAKSLNEMIQKKCESSCEKVCDAECKKQKNPPDEVCVLTCQHDCVASCSRRVASKLVHT